MCDTFGQATVRHLIIDKPTKKLDCGTEGSTIDNFLSSCACRQARENPFVFIIEHKFKEIHCPTIMPKNEPNALMNHY